MLKLEFPSMKHKELYEDMISEWNKFGGKIAPGRLFGANSYKNFLSMVNNDISNNENGVNSHLFFFMDEDELLGSIQVRHHINHPKLKNIGGHIGYGLKPSARGKGYATEMLRLGLIEAEKLGLKKVLITCSSDNIASRKVIEKNGGIFEKEIEAEGDRVNRYWIEI